MGRDGRCWMAMVNRNGSRPSTATSPADWHQQAPPLVRGGCLPREMAEALTPPANRQGLSSPRGVCRLRQQALALWPPLDLPMSLAAELPAALLRQRELPLPRLRALLVWRRQRSARQRLVGPQRPGLRQQSLRRRHVAARVRRPAPGRIRHELLQPPGHARGHPVRRPRVDRCSGAGVRARRVSPLRAARRRVVRREAGRPLVFQLQVRNRAACGFSFFRPPRSWCGRGGSSAAPDQTRPFVAGSSACAPPHPLSYRSNLSFPSYDFPSKLSRIRGA